MTPERWKQIEAIFQQALQLPADERLSFLDVTCDDNELRSEVEALLSAHAQAGSLLDHPSRFMPEGAPDEHQVSLTVGQSIGRYRIVSLLGKGGMGEVYRARDSQLGREVAVKVLPAIFAADTERLRRFEREAKAASALNHPNILTIHEIGQEDSVRFIVTEFVQGDTLRDKIYRDKIDLNALLEYFVQIADGLAKAHAAGIVHRDLKPDNIMITRDGFAKILDFGLAKLVESKGLQTKEPISTEVSTAILQHSTPGLVMGTVGYMSPEQAQGKSVDQRSDIFSFGCLLYEAATGQQPFVGESVIDTLHKIIYEPPVPIKEINALVPAELQRIVNKCLVKNAEQRYQTIKDAGLDLKELLRETKSGPNLRFEAGIGSSDTPAKAGVSTSRAGETAIAARPSTQERISSVEYIVGEIKQHRKVVIAGLLSMVALAGAIAFFYGRAVNKAPINSMAVMPFANAGDDPNLTYISEGISESLINSLSQLSDLRMIGYSSVRRFKGGETDPQNVGRQLGVEAILTGRVMQQGDRLFLSAELLNVADGSHIWGEQYNRKQTDLLTLEQDIASDVSHKLREKLSGVDEQKVTKTFTANAEAYQLYLKGRYHVLNLTLSEVQTGISYFQQAIALDPSYAQAYAGLADAYRSALAGDMPPTELLPKAKEAAQKAIQLDDSLADAHAELGFVIFWYDWDWTAAENQYKRALELDPNGVDTHLFYAHLLSNTGRHSEALAEVKRARELDPLNLRTNALEGQFLIHAGRSDEALARLQKTFEMAPNYYFAHFFAASAYIEKGMFPEAIAEARKARELSGPTNSHPMGFLGYALAKSGKQAEARAVLAELLKASSERYVSVYNIALIYNGLGERDKALEWLERGFQQRDQRMVFLKVEPKWNNLRDDPRFQDLMRRVGF